MPLLDANQIPGTFSHMVKKVCETYKYSVEDFYNPEKRKAKEGPAMVQIFQYFESQWIEGKNFTAKDWSCYKQEVRTNNTVESWHSKVNKEGGNKGMHIFRLGTFFFNHTEQVEKFNMSLLMWGGQTKTNDLINKLWI